MSGTSKVPGLIPADASDLVRRMDKRAADYRLDFKYLEFSKGDSSAIMVESKRWASVVADFIATLAD